MKRLNALAISLSLVLVVPAVFAQSQKEESLESTYARLCDKGQQSETCDVLRAALRKKLSDEGSAGTATSRAPSAAARPQRSVAVSPLWGFWAQLAGTTWLADNGTLYSYAWRRQGEEIGTEIIAANQTYEATITPAPDGSTLSLRIGSTPYTLQPQPDGSFLQALSTTRRTRYTMNGTAMTLAEDALVNGQWVRSAAPLITRRRLEPNEIEGQRAALARKRQEVEAVIASEWGILPRLIGEKYLSTSAEYPQYNSVATVQWIDRGTDAYLSWTYLASDKLAGWTRFTRNASTRKIEVRGHQGERGEAVMTADGRIRITWVPTEATRKFGTLQTDYYLAGGALRYDGYFLKDGKKQHATTNSSPAVTGRSNEELKVALAQQQQQRQQQQVAKANEKKSGGFAGALKGAVGGIAGVGQAGGGLNEALVGGAVGAVAGSAGVDAGTISATTATAFAPGSTAGAAAVSGGAGGRARYPTRPNALAGSPACSMMNESNYRQVGLSGGNDVQLKTMCAQAYEYYVMYKRAIAQGYAEADANRTYDAHAKSARVAIHYYQNNR